MPNPSVTRKSPVVQVLVLLFVVSLSSVILTQNASPISCIDQNPLIPLLKNDNVEVFTSPVASSSRICAAEWRAHQTCCKWRDTVEYARKDIKLAGAAIKELKSDLYTVLKRITAAEEKLFTAIQNNIKWNNGKMLDRVRQETSVC